MAGFCIHESSFRHVTGLPLLVRQLNNQLTTIHNQHRQQVFKSPGLDYVEIVEGVELCDLLYNESLGLIDHDDRMLLVHTLNRCKVWDDDYVIPDGEILFNGEPTECVSIKFVAANALESNAIGIISRLPVESVGVCAVSLGEESAEVFHVGLNTELDKFYRFQMCLEKVSRNDFRKWVHLAFPRLRFALELSAQLRRFQQDYDDIRDMIVDHLAAINDDFLTLLLTGTPLPEVCDRVKSDRGVDISPENANTHRNAKAMAERTVEFKGDRFVCEFHTKLTQTHDRIHFSPTICSEADDSKFLVVGPFAEHLTVSRRN